MSATNNIGTVCKHRCLSPCFPPRLLTSQDAVHVQPGSTRATSASQAAPGPSTPIEEHTSLQRSSHASAPTIPPKLQQQQEPQQQQQHVRTLKSGQLTELREALAACAQPDESTTTTLDLCGLTFKGVVKGALAIPSNVSLVSGVLQLPSKSQVCLGTVGGRSEWTV